MNRRPLLMLVTHSCPDLVVRVALAVEGGVDVVQLRDKEMERAALSEVSRELHKHMRSPSTLIVNGSCLAAIESGADGVHLPESALTGDFEAARGAGLSIGASVHSTGAARSAVGFGADYLVAGSIYETESHPGRASAGLAFLASVCQAVSVPVLAIGGITPARAAECLAAGAAGVAVLSGIMDALSPKRAATQYRVALDEAWRRNGNG